MTFENCDRRSDLATPWWNAGTEMATEQVPVVLELANAQWFDRWHELPGSGRPTSRCRRAPEQLIMPILLALLSSALWGTSDFFGGTASKTTPSTTVLLWASLIALPVMTVIAVISGDLVFDSTVVVWGIVAGVSCSIGIVLLYRGLATGPMGVVAPIASTSVLVPVIAGFVRGESPGALQTIGIAIAVVGAGFWPGTSSA